MGKRSSEEAFAAPFGKTMWSTHAFSFLFSLVSSLGLVGFGVVALRIVLEFAHSLLGWSGGSTWILVFLAHTVSRRTSRLNGTLLFVLLMALPTQAVDSAALQAIAWKATEGPERLPTWIADLALTLAMAGLILFENLRLGPEHELLGFPERDDSTPTTSTEDDPSVHSQALSYDEQLRRARLAVKYTLRLNNAAAQIYSKGADMRAGLEALCRKYGAIIPTAKQQARQQLRVLRDSLDQHLPRLRHVWIDI
ncbi:MAG: hypothetical protein ACO35D_06330, partial [Aquiluna sp.]